MHDCDTYFTAWPRFLTLTMHFYVLGGPLMTLNINDPDGTIYVVIFGPAGPLMYPDQISRYRAMRLPRRLQYRDRVTPSLSRIIRWFSLCGWIIAASSFCYWERVAPSCQAPPITYIIKYI